MAKTVDWLMAHKNYKINHWSPDEDAALREAIGRGENFTQAAVSVGRPVKATTARAYRIGLRSGQPPTITFQ